MRTGKKPTFQVQGVEQLESRNLLAGHAFGAVFASQPFFSSSHQIAPATVASTVAAHSAFFSQYGSSSSSSGSLSGSLTDSGGNSATISFQTGNLLGVTQAVLTVTGDTSAAGTSVPITINGASVGTIAINGSGSGTLTLPLASLTTTVAAASTVTLGGLSGTLSTATTTPGTGLGCSGHGHDDHSSLTSTVTDSSGNTATVAFQTGNLLGVLQAVVTVTGDTSVAGTSVPVTINGTSVGSIAMDSSGAGTLTVPLSSLTTTVGAASAISLGGLSGTLAASTTTPEPDLGGCSHSGGFTASLTDASGNTATLAFQSGNLLGVSVSVVKVTGATSAAGTSVPLTINGVSVGAVPIDTSGSGSLTLPTSSLSTTVAAGSTISLGNLGGTFAASTPTISYGGFFRRGRH